MIIFDEGLDLRCVNRENIYEVLSQDRKVDTRYGFLHIPKTGGTSFRDFLAKADDRISTRPILFFHSWSLPLIHSYLPDVKVSFIIRDPLERLISGFQSRLRCGRPRYNQPWRTNEAVAFSIFPTVRDLLDRLLLKDDYSLSATSFAIKHILAIAWNYESYFHSVEEIKRYRENIHVVGQIDSMDAFLEKICSTTVRASDHATSAECILGFYEIRHQSDQASKGVLSEYSEDDIRGLQMRLQKEYDIYETLKLIALEQC